MNDRINGSPVHRHLHTFEQPRRVALHPANNGRVWLAVLGIVTVAVFITAIVTAMLVNRQAPPAVQPVKAAPVVPAAPVKGQSESASSAVSEPKGSNNSGERNNNINVEGNQNNVHVGHNVTHHHHYTRTVVTQETVTRTVPVKTTVYVEQQRTGRAAKTTTVRAECEDHMERHRRTVAAWTKQMNQ